MPLLAVGSVRVVISIALITGGHLLATGAQQPRFRTETTIIEVAAVVTRQDDVVRDLSREEVRVLDNGVEQPLVAFEFIDHLAPDSHSKGVRTAQEYVLVLDDLGIAPRLTKASADVARFLLGALEEDDRLAIVNTGPHELVQQLTTDRAAARALIGKFRGQKGVRRGSGAQVCHDTTVLLSVVRNVAKALEAEASARRAVLVVSEGHRIFMETPAAGRIDICDEARVAYESVVAAAAVSNVAIYGIDPRGLEAPIPAYGTSFGDAVVGAGQEASHRADRMASRYFGSLGLMAEATGGRLTTDRNDLVANIPLMLRDSRQYYRIAYLQPAVPAEERDVVRRIQVKVSRPGVVVRARQRYLPR